MAREEWAFSARKAPIFIRKRGPSVVRRKRDGRSFKSNKKRREESDRNTKCPPATLIIDSGGGGGGGKYEERGPSSSTLQLEPINLGVKLCPHITDRTVYFVSCRDGLWAFSCSKGFFFPRAICICMSLLRNFSAALRKD